MGGEGSMSAANQSLKMNRKALRSKRKGYKSNYDSATLSKQKIISKDISEEELADIKSQIRQKAKARRKLNALIFTSILVIVTFMILLFMI